jgi:hypothetical protein
MAGQLTFYSLGSDIVGQFINSTEKNLHMTNEAFCDENTIDIGPIANMQEHIGDTSSRGLFKG